MTQAQNQQVPQYFVMAPMADIEAAIDRTMQRYVAHVNKIVRTDGYLNADEAAQYMGVNRNILATQRNRCQGPPYIKDGKNIRYKKSDIDTYMERRKVKTSLEA